MQHGLGYLTKAAHDNKALSYFADHTTQALTCKLLCKWKDSPSRRTYLYSSFLINSTMISFSGCNCSSFSSRHIKFVGFLAPPKVPPTWVSCTALSTKDSAVNPKQCSFQYMDSQIFVRRIFSTKFCRNFGRQGKRQTETFVTGSTISFKVPAWLSSIFERHSIVCLHTCGFVP